MDGSKPYCVVSTFKNAVVPTVEKLVEPFKVPSSYPLNLAI